MANTRSVNIVFSGVKLGLGMYALIFGMRWFVNSLNELQFVRQIENENNRLLKPPTTLIKSSPERVSAVKQTGLVHLAASGLCFYTAYRRVMKEPMGMPEVAVGALACLHGLSKIFRKV